MSVSIVKLTDGAKLIAGGNLDTEVEISSHDEVGDLASAFNKMTGDLKQYINDLQETTAAKERIEADLRIAHDIQINVLPRIFPAFPDRKEFDIFAYIEPAKEVGGDLYDFFFIDENRLFFLIGDVSGKGVPAALFMMITKAVIKSEVMRGASPKKILYEANNIISVDNDSSMFVTVFCAVLDVRTGELEYGNAGHNPPLIYRSGQDYEYMDIKGSFVFGPMPDTEFSGGKLKLNPNDVIFLYTDGVTEAMNAQKKLFSEQRLQETLSDLGGSDVKEILPGVRERMREFVEDAPQSDDITMLALKFNLLA
jgi:sigma-B regulation protein RsbU (phosphoserine phosphatase)